MEYINNSDFEIIPVKINARMYSTFKHSEYVIDD